MDYNFKHDSFSYPFNVLRYMGLWSYDSDNVFKKSLYHFYRLFIGVYGWQLAVLGFIDLYIHRNDFKRVIYNMCTTVFTFGLAIKSLYLLRKTDPIDNLRVKLFRDALVQSNDEEDVAILQKFRYTLDLVRNIFFIVYVLFYPVWMVSSLMSLKRGPRELPFPVWMPLDLDDNYQFAFGFLYHAFGGTFVVAEAAHWDLAMYSLILQTAGQYAIMKKNLMKMNKIYQNSEFGYKNYCSEKKIEINKILMQQLMREKFKKFLKRQLELRDYVKEIEGSYSKVMVMQLLGGLILSIGNGLELLVVSMNFSIKIFYQFAFFMIILSDLFICCALADSLLDECKKISLALYSLAWYDMSRESKKDILIMTMATQKLPALTVGKLLPLSLPTYLGFIRNLYSWMALFRQILIKK